MPAAVFVAEIGDVTCFPGPKQLCSWAGLTPGRRESDLTCEQMNLSAGQGTAQVGRVGLEPTADGL
ncbi:transposase [Streptomyces sp. NPDC059690]|uniref:transposase n=1 Tax=Streptomyces sp. NPDC059690 TaxID=3346907 RepID=UPI0036A74C49